MRFRLEELRSDTPDDRQLVYRVDDLSFDVEPGQNGFTSILVNELSIEIEESGKISSVWGYCPYPSWIKSKIAPPSANRSSAFAIGDAPFLMGVSQKANTDGRWQVFVDWQSGWVSLDSGHQIKRSVEIFSGAILGLDCNQQLVTVYLRPDRLPGAR